jgi:hypothetical protein
MEDDFEDFDEVSNQFINEMIERELERSMRYALETIEGMGPVNWSNYVTFSDERKIIILENMIKWFEAREEYEACALLVKTIKVVNEQREKSC